jgi:hypothetical protein
MTKKPFHDNRRKKHSSDGRCCADSGSFICPDCKKRSLNAQDGTCQNCGRDPNYGPFDDLGDGRFGD